MIRIFLLTLLLIVAYTNSYSQDSIRLDSLQRLIDGATSDNGKYKLIYHAINHEGFVGEDFQNLVDQARSLSQNNPNRLDSLDFSIGLVYYNEGKTKEALKIFQRLDSLARINKDALLTARTQLGISMYDMNTGALSQAEEKTLEAIGIFKNLGNKYELINAYNSMANIRRKGGRSEEAIAYIDSSMILIGTIDPEAVFDHQVIFNAYNIQGNLRRDLGENDAAKQSFENARDVALENNYKKYLSGAYNNLGNMAQIAGNLDEAIGYYLKSIDIKQKLNNIRGMAIGYHNLGALELDMDNFDSAEKYLKQSLDISLEKNFDALIVYNYNKMASVYKQTQRFADAEKYYKKGIVLAEKVKFKKGELSGKVGLGETYAQNGQFSAAYPYYVEGLEIARAYKSKPYESAVLSNIASLFTAANDAGEGIVGLRPGAVEDYLDRALELADEMQNPENQEIALEAQVAFYKSTNNFKALSSTQNLLLDLRDTMYVNQKIELTKELETRFKTAEQEKEIIQLESDKKLAALQAAKNRNIFLGIIGFLVLGLLLGYQLLKYRNSVKKREEQDIFRSKLSAELHDDVGTILTGLAMQSELLSDIASDSAKSTAERISTMSRSAMDKMRDTVWAIDARKDTVEDLADRMLDFAEEMLEAKGMTVDFNKSGFDTSSSIDPEIRQNLYLIFKEAVTNAAKHSNGDRFIVVLSKSSKDIVLSIKDNGTDFSKEKNSSGLGLSNIKMRTQQLNGHVRFNYNAGFGFTVNVSLS